MSARPTDRNPTFVYRVPVVHLVEFGMDIGVEAHNLTEAKRLALAGNEGRYDLNRMNFKSARLGTWQPIEFMGEA